jgi:hypothetical protein
MRYWTEKFNLDKEDFSNVPVWIRLYSLPQEYWDKDILTGLGNTLGKFIKILEATKQGKYIAYA